MFTDLDFYLWRFRYLPNTEWRPEIMVRGSPKALTIMRDAIQAMQEEFKIHGESTRKFLCNPPEDEDVYRYAKLRNAKIEWLIWLVLRLQKDPPTFADYEIKNKAVTVTLNDKTAEKLVEIIDNELDSEKEFPNGQHAPGGLFFAPNWLGVE
jgi:hypothetical protein